MKNLIFTIEIILIFQSCVIRREINNEILLEPNSKLYQAKHVVPPVYVLIKGDTAYYEYLEKDKEIKFVGFDTLVRKLYTNCFIGKSNFKLFQNNNDVCMDSLCSKKSKLKFAIASVEQISDWNFRKNNDKYRRFYGRVKTALEGNDLKGGIVSTISRELKELGQLCPKLNQTKFDSALNSFEKKYLIK
jgi:hypothetical protein